MGCYEYCFFITRPTGIEVHLKFFFTQNTLLLKEHPNLTAIAAVLRASQGGIRWELLIIIIERKKLGCSLLVYDGGVK